ncbi:unnamed protein product, partial [Symbiodinium pilosum]
MPGPSSSDYSDSREFIDLSRALALLTRLQLEGTQGCPANRRRWLNRDLKMQQWFARIAKREKPMLFITEMLLEPGLDKFIVDLLLRRGNDMALRTMLDYWVHTEGSFASVFGSFSKKPGIERALARVVISPGFLDGFVFRKFLWQEGLGDLALEAATLVGVRGLVDNVLPLLSAILLAVLVLSVQGFITEFDQP